MTTFKYSGEKVEIDGKGAQPHACLMLMYRISAQGVARPCVSLAGLHTNSALKDSLLSCPVDLSSARGDKK